MSQSDKEDFESQLHECKRLLSHKVHKSLNKKDPQQVLIAQALVAKNFIYSQQDELKCYLMRNNQGTELEEEELGILYSISRSELATLSDLKALPCSVLWNSLLDFMTHWYFTQFPDEFGSGSLSQLSSLSATKLPLGKFCAALIETAYWPIFKKFLETATSLPGPAQHCASATTIQYYLNRIAINYLYSLNSMATIQFPDLYTIPISQFPSDSDLLRMVNMGIRNTVSTIIRNWYLTETGQQFWRGCRTNNFDSIKRIMNALLCLSTIKDVTNVPDEKIYIFTYSNEKKK